MSTLDEGFIQRRDGFRCVRCGKVVSLGQFSIHHRILGNRKDRRASNLITLCGSGTTGCHGWVHAHPKDAMELGYIVSKFVRRDLLPQQPVYYGQTGGHIGWFLLGDNLTLTAESGDHETRNA